MVGHICTATVTRDGRGDIASVKYNPALDINNQPVREITEKDLDEIGAAVMATIIEGV